MPVLSTGWRVPNRWAGGTIQSIFTSTSTGAKRAWDLRGGYTTFAMQCQGLVSGDKVLLEGSIDGSNWKTLGSTAGYTSTAEVLTKSTSSTPVQFVRNRLAASGSTAGEIIAWISCA